MSPERDVAANTATGSALSELTSCPQCGAPAEITRRDVLESTDGPVEHVGVRCVQWHTFLMPTYCLDRRAQSQQGQPTVPHRTGGQLQS